MVDYRKLLRDVIRGCLTEWDAVPTPAPGRMMLSDDDEDAIELLTDEEAEAFVELVCEIKAEAIAGGETRRVILEDIDRVISECLE